MKEKGGILKVCLVRKGSPEIKTESFEKLPENYICLIVSDTGCGMSKTTLNRIFEPYFTTKSKEEGTGLGLSVVSGIVKEHGGEIYTRTYPNEGTYFKLTFPIVERSVESGSLRHSSVKCDNSLHIMAVDDEPQITFMMKFMLEEIGHTSETFTDPLQALDIFLRDPSKYDLVITDQTMPGILGTDLSKKMLEIRPGIPIILNTGYSPVASKSEAKKIGIKQFVMKPLTISDLSFAINESVRSKN
jgi:CheY-like chemotaxis protein